MKLSEDARPLTQSNAYRRRIHELIPGGAHTYTKGDDQFPANAPAAIARGLGAHVWDPDGNKYLDCSMGLTSVSLGHAYEPVLARVRDELSRGVNFQRPSVIELQMAEAFLSLVPGHDMIKFAKNGSTTTTAAVKLARAFTGRSRVAFPKDHPFYSYDDWFIASTPCGRGVPDAFKALSLTYDSKDLSTLAALLEAHPGEVACVISEPEKPEGIAPGYLRELIDLAHKHGALFVQDEMITGFKTDFPGSLTKHGVVPDLATWGKGIANGFSFCALTGRREIMELGGITRLGAEKVFLISTTHGGETHAMAACLATIEEFKTKNVLAHNHAIGRSFSKQVAGAVERAGLTRYVEVVQSDWMPMIIFKDRTEAASAGFKTLALQEMIKRGVLFQGIFIPCFSHVEADVTFFLQAFEETLSVYARALEQGYESLLVGDPVKPVFRKVL